MKNQFLKHLSEAELSVFSENMEHVQLSLGEALYEPHNKMTHLYFPEDSMISLISVTRDGSTVEVGVVGAEGLIGLGAIFERERSPYQAMVQASGAAYKVNVKALRKAFRQRGHLQDQLLSYFLVVHDQVAQSAICNKFHSVQERMAKWLLLSMERTGKNTLKYTHEFLSMMLGARRTTISRCLKSLQARGLIRTQRGRITILLPSKLEALACECYEIISSELNNLN